MLFLSIHQLFLLLGKGLKVQGNHPVQDTEEIERNLLLLQPQLPQQQYQQPRSLEEEGKRRNQSQCLNHLDKSHTRTWHQMS